jgi:hypothetical protein
MSASLTARVVVSNSTELGQLRELLRDMVFGLARLPYWVWDTQLCEWEQLCFNGTLTNFRTRDRHPTKPYTDTKRGPVFKHMLVCDVADGELASLKACIERRLSLDAELFSACYMGELVKRVWEYKPSSADHSLGRGKMRKGWLCEGRKDVDEFEARRMNEFSIKVAEDPHWTADMKAIPHFEQLQRQHMAQGPWKPRYMIDIDSEPCGFQVGGGKYMHYNDDFSSRNEAQAAGDGAKAELRTREEMRSRDAYVLEWQKWKSGKGNCSFTPLRPACSRNDDHASIPRSPAKRPTRARSSATCSWFARSARQSTRKDQILERRAKS